MGQTDDQEAIQNNIKDGKIMRLNEEDKLNILLNMDYEPDEAEAIMDAITDGHVSKDEFSELVNNIKNNWRY